MRKDLNREACEFILRHLLPTEGITAKELSKKCGLSSREIGWIARKLILEGHLVKENGLGYTGSEVIYYKCEPLSSS